MELEKEKSQNVKLKLIMGVTLSEMGGAQKVVYHIISCLSENKYDITLITSPGGELIKWIEELNTYRQSKVKVIEIPHLKRDISPLNDLKTFFTLLKIMKMRRYDVAHFHSSKMGMLGRFAAWIARIPKILFTVHGWGINQYQNVIKQRIFGFLEKIAGKLSTKIICVSNSDAQKGVKKGWIKSKKTCVIYNGINGNSTVKGKLRETFNIDENQIIIGTIERLKEPKDPIFTIEVFNLLRKKGYNIKLVIIGEGPLRKKCEELIYNLDLKHDVLLLGNREDARELLNDVDIFVLFSKWEGLPLVIIEAMFAAKPVVASEVGGIPELIESGKGGYLIDDFNILKAAYFVELLIRDGDLRKEMGTFNEIMANQKFTETNMVRKYEEIYWE